MKNFLLVLLIIAGLDYPLLPQTKKETIKIGGESVKLFTTKYLAIKLNDVNSNLILKDGKIMNSNILSSINIGGDTYYIIGLMNNTDIEKSIIDLKKMNEIDFISKVYQPNLEKKKFVFFSNDIIVKFKDGGSKRRSIENLQQKGLKFIGDAKNYDKIQLYKADNKIFELKTYFENNENISYALPNAVFIDDSYFNSDIIKRNIPHSFIIFPQVQGGNEKFEKTNFAIPTVLAATAIGAGVSGVSYAISIWINGERFDGYDFTAALLVGAAAGAAPILLAFFPDIVLETLFGGSTGAAVSEALEGYLSDFIRNIGALFTKAGDITLKKIKDAFISHKGGFEEIMIPKLAQMELINGGPGNIFYDEIWADLSKANIETNGITPNLIDAKYSVENSSWELNNPGNSKLEFLFNYNKQIDGAKLSLNHISSGLNVNGSAPIEIIINGKKFLDKYDVIQNHNNVTNFYNDEWQIGNFLVSGQNKVEIKLNNEAFSNYYIGSFSISPGYIHSKIDDYEITNFGTVYPHTNSTINGTVELKANLPSNTLKVEFYYKKGPQDWQLIGIDSDIENGWTTNFNTINIGNSDGENVQIKYKAFASNLSSIEQITNLVIDQNPQVPILNIEPNELILNLEKGSSTDETLNITNAGTGELNWFVNDTPPEWLTLNKFSGQETTVDVTLNTNDLGAGNTYKYSIKFNSNGGEKLVPVQLTVGGNNPPILNGTEVDPKDGDDTTTFTYIVKYHDRDGDVPQKQSIYIDGNEYPMSLLSPNPNYEKSTEFYYQKKLLPNINHQYYFEFSDGKGSVVKSETEYGPLVNPVKPRIRIIAPNINNQTADTSFTINWHAEGAAYISLYYDNDTDPNSGYKTIIENTENDSFYVWNTSNLPNGNYHIYGIVNNLGIIDYDYSNFPLIVNHGALHIPTISLSEPIPVANGDEIKTVIRDSLNIFIIYDDVSGNLYFKKSSDGGYIYSDSIKINETSGVRNGTIQIIDTKNDLHVIWTQKNLNDNTEVHYSMSSDNGGNWTNPVIISNNDLISSLEPDGIINTSSYITVFWVEEVGGREQLFRRRLDKNSKTWGSINQISFNNNDDVDHNSEISVIAKGDDIFLAFYYQNDDEILKVIRSMDQGQTFSAPTNLPDINGWDVSHPKLANHKDNIYCTWDERAIQISRSVDLGLTWELISQIPNASTRPVAIESDGVNLSIIDRDGKYYESSDNGSSWSSPILIDPNLSSSDIEYKNYGGKRFIFYKTAEGLKLKRDILANMLPTISINVVNNNDIYSDSILISWNASDNDGDLPNNVTLEYSSEDLTTQGKIDENLANNGSKWWKIKNIPKGNYLINGKVIDNNGAVVYSNAILVKINHSPIVSFTSMKTGIDTIFADYKIGWSISEIDGDSIVANELYYTNKGDTVLLFNNNNFTDNIYTWNFRNIPNSDSIHIFVRSGDENSIMKDYKLNLNLIKSDGFTISGTVRSYGSPVEGVEVKIAGTFLDSVYTNSSGKFEFMNVPVGFYVIAPSEYAGNSNDSLELNPQYYGLNINSNIDTLNFVYPITGTETSDIPLEFDLSQNYPNPFNPSTRIRYSIPKTSFVTIKVYDILGREVQTLVNEEKSVGNYEINFNASNLSSGIYFYQLNAEDFVQTRKMILLR